MRRSPQPGFSRRSAAHGLVLVVALALSSSACAGLRTTAPDLLAERAEAAEAATKAVSDATSWSAAVSRETVARVMERRIATANGLVDSVVAVLRSVRLAAPSTRAIDPAGVARTRELVALAHEHVVSRRAEAVWSAIPLAPMLDEATAVLDETTAFLDYCEAGRTTEADFAYDRVFARYERFRRTAVEVARTSAEDPLTLWARTPAPRPPVDATTASR